VSELDKVRANRVLSLDDAAAFHGHKGPFLVIGYRAGKYAVEVLKPETEFDLETEAYIPYKTPYSCVLAGLQCATKCTWGKGNIKCYNDGKFMIRIKHRKNGRTLTLILKDEYLDIFLKEPIEIAVKKAEETPIEKLFKVTIT